MRLPSEHIPPRLSVIIPIFRDDNALAHLLGRLETMDAAKVYIVDGEGRLEPPAALSNILSAFKDLTWCTAPRGRGPQIAQGINRAIQDKSCEAIWVLHADSAPHHGSIQDIFHILSTPKTALGMFSLNFDRPQLAYRLFEVFARIETGLTSFGDQGFFFRRADIAALWPQLQTDLINSPILEDMVLRRALKRRGRVKKSSLKIGTSPRRFERYGLWRTQFRNMFILLRARLGVSPKRLYESYYNPAPAALLNHDKEAPRRVIMRS